MNKFSGDSGEKLLLKALINKDRDAYKHVLARYKDSIIRVCRGFVNSHEDAEDIAQEVFIQLFKSSRSFRGDSKLSTWLYRVAVNKAINHIRSGKSKQTTSLYSVDDSLNLESSEKADNSIQVDEHSRILKSSMNILPDNQRTAFILSKYDDLSYKEISEVMNMSISSVQSLIFRAKKNLQDSLRDYYEENLL